MLPKFPILITFDIANSSETRDVWAHRQARTLALLWKPCHIVNQDFWSECLILGREIEKRKPTTSDELARCLNIRRLHVGGNFTPYDIQNFVGEALPYFMGKDVPFKIVHTDISAKKEAAQ